MKGEVLDCLESAAEGFWEFLNPVVAFPTWIKRLANEETLWQNWSRYRNNLESISEGVGMIGGLAASAAIIIGSRYLADNGEAAIPIAAASVFHGVSLLKEALHFSYNLERFRDLKDGRRDEEYRPF